MGTPRPEVWPDRAWDFDGIDLPDPQKSSLKGKLRRMTSSPKCSMNHKSKWAIGSRCSVQLMQIKHVAVVKF